MDNEKINEELSTIDEIVEEDKEEVSSIDEIVEDDNSEKKKKKRLSKEEKLRRKYFFETDIKYRGPLSYRYLRIIAWISIAVSQILLINSITPTILGRNLLGEGFEGFLSFIAALYVPLFIIATFATILNKSNPIKHIIIFYAIAYLGLALSLIFLYYRYINGVLADIGIEKEGLKAASQAFGKKFEINVFADLLALSLFYYFVMYKPKKYFSGKKIYLFRLCALLPLLFALISYLIRLFSNLDYYTLPFALNIFLTTKSPLIYVLFIVLTFWLRKKEKTYYKLGGNHEGFQKFERSNRNSLSFSIFISVWCLILSIIDIFVYAFFFGAFEDSATYIDAFKIGECAGLVFAIPILMGFSYSRKHKQSNLDIIIVIGGIGLIVLSYIEMIYQIIIAI